MHLIGIYYLFRGNLCTYMISPKENKLLSNMTIVDLNMTGFVVYKTGFVIHISGFFLNMTGFGITMN